MRSAARLVLLVCAICLLGRGGMGVCAEPASQDAAAPRPKRLLLIGQGPDSHPWSTHEYMAGMRILASCLQPVEGLQVILVQADVPWRDGPELLDGADGAVLFVSEGAKWLQEDPQRFRSFERLAARGGGLVALHWAMGCKDARFIEGFVRLFGGCHGGADRKYRVARLPLEVEATDHIVTRGVQPIEVEDEFYYALKFAKSGGRFAPLVRVRLEGELHTIAWAWERPGGGRSFGFSGLHFHRNWEHEAYRRLVTQGVLWSLGLSVPGDLPLAYDPQDLETPRPKPE